MGKGKRDNRPGQRKGAQHQQPPKTSAPTVSPIAPPAKVESQVQPASANGGTGGNSQQQAVDIGQRVSRHVLLDSIFTFVIAVSAVVAAVVAYYQWDAMSEQNADTRRQADLALKATQQTDKTLEMMWMEQRPRVMVDKIELVDAFADTTTMRFRFINRGKSPAYMREYRCTYFYVPSPNGRENWVEAEQIAIDKRLFDEFKGIKNPRFGDPIETIFPGEPAETHVSRLSVSAEQVQSADDGKGIIFAVGQVTYEDSLGRKYETPISLFGNRKGGMDKYPYGKMNRPN